FYLTYRRYFLPSLAAEKLKFFVALSIFCTMAYGLKFSSSFFEKKIGKKSFTYSVGNCAPQFSLFLKNRMGQDILDFSYRLFKPAIGYALYSMEDSCKVNQVLNQCRDVQCVQQAVSYIQEKSPLLSLPKYSITVHLLRQKMESKDELFQKANQILAVWDLLFAPEAQSRALKRINPKFNLKKAKTLYQSNAKTWEELAIRSALIKIPADQLDAGIYFL